MGLNMSEDEVRILRGYELRLLRCTLRRPPSTPSPLPPPSDCNTSDDCPLSVLISETLTSIETGDYIGALSSKAARLVLESPDSQLPGSPDRAYSNLIDRVDSFISNDSVDESTKAFRVVLVMCIAVAAFFYFTQCNMTGPVEGLLKRPFPMKAWWEGNGMEEWEIWARNELMAAGSDLLGKFSFLQYIVFAKMLLLKTKDLLFEAIMVSTFGIRSISWWLFRFLLFHQRILNDRSSSLFDLLQVFMGETLHHFGTLENVNSYWDANLLDGEASTIVSVLHLEAGVLEYIYSRPDPCRQHFESASVAAGLQLSLTGVLGLRTVHQVEPKAQMVLVANKSTKSSGDTVTSLDPGLKSYSSSISNDSDILMAPKLLENGNYCGNKEQCFQNCGGAGAPLTAVQQALVLVQCLLVQKTTRQDEMQGWDMAPYIEAVDSQQSSYFILRCFCDILRIRWESTRSHTKERAFQMMHNLVESIQKASVGVSERLPFCYVVYIPTIPALRKEYGELLISCGLIGEAITIFEDLELWDNLIECYCLLGKRAAAVELIKTRLSEIPSDPRLWCSLGDVTNDDACYEKALEVSHGRSIRAKRSLARSAYARADYQTAKKLWESVMALNSLYPDGWFALGAAALKARDVERSLDAFTRAVQLDPENGEAWNNIACLHMIRKKSKESFIAFKEALKFKRESWQMWENYSYVALDVGNIFQALEAVKMVLTLTNNKRIDVEVLDRIIQYLEESSSISLSVGINGDNCANEVSEDSHVGSINELANAGQNVEKSREKEHLVEFLGKILQQIVKRESNADVWGLYARWHRINGDLTMCSEALLKQVRSYQGSDLWRDEERFKKFARSSLELCKIYMEICSSMGSRRELFTAEMHLQNVLKQASGFSGMEEYRALQACLDEVKMKIQSK